MKCKCMRVDSTYSQGTQGRKKACYKTMLCEASEPVYPKKRQWPIVTTLYKIYAVKKLTRQVVASSKWVQTVRRVAIIKYIMTGSMKLNIVRVFCLFSLTGVCVGAYLHFSHNLPIAVKTQTHKVEHFIPHFAATSLPWQPTEQEQHELNAMLLIHISHHALNVNGLFMLLCESEIQLY